MTGPTASITSTPLRSEAWPRRTFSAKEDDSILRREYGDNWNDFAARALNGNHNAVISPGAVTALGGELTADEAHLVTTSTYFAQCAANASVANRRAESDRWYDAYLSGLSSLGFWQSSVHIDQPFETMTNNFVIDQAVAELLCSAANFAGAPATLLGALISRLTQPGMSGKARLLDETIRNGRNINFMYAVARRVGPAVHLGVAHLSLDIDDLESTFLGLQFHRSRAHGFARVNGLVLDSAAAQPIAGALFSRMDTLVVNHLKNVPLTP